MYYLALEVDMMIVPWICLYSIICTHRRLLLPPIHCGL